MTDMTEETLQFEYDGRHVPFAKIVAVNAIYQLLTAMIFRFWARTRERKYLWSHVRLGDDRLEYTGTGLELFLGFLIVLGVILFPVIGGFTLVMILFGDNPVVFGVVYALYILVIVFLMYVAIYRARRYRLTRTLWRGIRGTLTGSSVRYAFVAMGYTLLVMATLGLASPVMRIGLVRREIENMHLGNRPFTFHGKIGDLFRLWILPWLSLPLLLGVLFMSGAYDSPAFNPAAEGGGPPKMTGGVAAATLFAYLLTILAMSWYRVAEFRYLASSVGFEGMRFSSALGFGRVFWIYLSSYLLIFGCFILFFMALMGVFVGLVGWEIFAAAANNDVDPETIAAGMDQQRIAAVFVLFGFIFAVGSHVLNRVLVFHRMAHAVVTSLALSGTQDFSKVAQALDEAPKLGEGLADAFDLGDF
ncbi:MAG: YjgN family protein [Alphaproteobacteria bacterium]|nr:YjgN family protein [Alphaproteobacteria bacterium]